jgi:hypothetical protein
MDEEERMHIIMGEAFLSQQTDRSKMYNAAVHFNAARRIGSLALQPAKLARVNLEAAKYCRENAAFPSAARFLRSGLEKLKEARGQKWTEQNFDLT